MTELQRRVAELQRRILLESYYVPAWKSVLDAQGMSIESIAQHQHSDETLGLTCHLFWEALPDSMEIRRGPFFDLCDIASDAL